MQTDSDELITQAVVSVSKLLNVASCESVCCTMRVHMNENTRIDIHIK